MELFNPTSFLVLWGIFTGVVFLLPIMALIDLLRNDFRGNDKVVWVLVVIFIAFVGPILYFIIGRRQRISR